MHSRTTELRAAINRLPLHTRRAMLEGIQSKPVIAGADGDPRGGVCPIYASERPPSERIGRPFARAWDRYAGARLARPATERELRALSTMLEASIDQDTEEVVSLHAGIAAHKASQARNRAAEAARVREERPPVADTRAPAPRREDGGQDRSEELARRHGWAWLRPVRRLDDYERALQTLGELAGELPSETEPERLVPSPYARS